jgi:hypothetical protein
MTGNFKRRITGIISIIVVCLVTSEIYATDTYHQNWDWDLKVNFSTRIEENRWNISGYLYVTLHWTPPPDKQIYSYRIYYHGELKQTAWGSSATFCIYHGTFEGDHKYGDFSLKVEEILNNPQTFRFDVSSHTEFLFSVYLHYEPPPLEATNPNPEDGAIVILSQGEQLDFSWSSGRKAVTHDVYFGENFDNVNTGTEDVFLGNMRGFFSLGAPGLPYPDGLSLCTIYYWRVDEIEDNGTKHKGDVWRFTIKPPIPITDPNLICWWKFDLGEGIYVLDWSGYGHDGTLHGNPEWVNGRNGYALHIDEGGGYVTHSLDDEVNWQTGTVMLWVKADNAEQNLRSGIFSSHASSYAGFNFDTDGIDPGNYKLNPGNLTFGDIVIDWVHLALTYDSTPVKLYYNGSWVESGILNDTSFNQFAAGIGSNVARPLSGAIDDFRIYNKALSQAEIKQIMRFNQQLAWDPNPANGSTPDIEQASILSWLPGNNAIQHDVYFGTDFDSVKNAGISDNSETYQGRQTDTDYVIDEIYRGHTYYWRIDEVEIDGITIHKGDVWRFMVWPEKAYNPHPSNNEEIIDQNVVLSWTAGFGGVFHDIYFGTYFDYVKDANISKGLGVYQGRNIDVNFIAEELDFGQTYYWRVDEVEADDTTIHQGDTWSFTILERETVEYQVSSNKDDGYAENDEAQFLDYDFMRVGASSFFPSPYFVSAMVFRNVDIPRGAKIVGAHLKIRSQNSSLTNIVYGRIQAEATNNATAFGGFRNIASLDKSSAFVNWDHHEPWLENTWYESPDIAGVIQEVINRDGWIANNSLAIIYSTRQNEGGHRKFSSYEYGSDYAAKLEITFIP